MLGEALVAIAEIKPRLLELKEEREIFRLANDETMHPFVFAKRMREYDDLIAVYEAELADREEAYQEIINAEIESIETDFPPDPDPFIQTFDELSQIDGINPVEHFDRIISVRHLMKAF